MKNIIGLLIIITVSFYNCNKEYESEKNDLKIDSIDLMYVDCPDTNFITLFPMDSIKISVETWTVYYGPHAYTNERVWIKSTNPDKIMISFGKIQNNNLYLLDKDSLIDESLAWHDTYVSGGYIQGVIGFRSNYVGIKINDNGKIFYGWIHTPTCYKITEFAFDTSSVVDRNIFAGRLKK